MKSYINNLLLIIIFCFCAIQPAQGLEVSVGSDYKSRIGGTVDALSNKLHTLANSTETNSDFLAAKQADIITTQNKLTATKNRISLIENCSKNNMLYSTALKKCILAEPNADQILDQLGCGANEVISIDSQGKVVCASPSVSCNCPATTNTYKMTVYGWMYAVAKTTITTNMPATTTCHQTYTNNTTFNYKPAYTAANINVPISIRSICTESGWTVMNRYWVPWAFDFSSGKKWYTLN